MWIHTKLKKNVEKIVCHHEQLFHFRLEFKVSSNIWKRWLDSSISWLYVLLLWLSVSFFQKVEIRKQFQLHIALRSKLTSLKLNAVSNQKCFFASFLTILSILLHLGKLHTQRTSEISTLLKLFSLILICQLNWKQKRVSNVVFDSPYQDCFLD